MRYPIGPNGERESKESALSVRPSGNEVRFGSVSFINGISTFVGYLMPKLFSKKDSSGTI